MKRRLRTTVAALVLAAVGTFLVFLYVQDADRRALAGKQAAEVLVAARAIPAGTPVSSLVSGGWARRVRMPAETLPDDAVRSVEGEPADRVTGSALRPGELIRRPLLVPRGRSQAFSVPDGKLAVTVALTDPQRVAGHVGAGSKVAVFVSYKLLDSAGRPRNDATGTRLLMSGIEVLSIGPATPPKDGSAAADAKTLVTLAVAQREAEKLIWAGHGAQGASQQTGLYLALQTDSSAVDPGSPGVSSFTFLR